QQNIAGHLGAHGAIAKDEMREDREDSFARGALDPPDGEPTQPDPEVMRVTRQASSTATRRLMLELKATRQNEREDTLEKRLTITQQLNVSGFALEVDGKRSVFTGLVGWFSHGSPSGHGVCAVSDPPWG